MRYTEKDIHNIWITQFLDALGEKQEKEFDDLNSTMHHIAMTPNRCSVLTIL